MIISGVTYNDAQLKWLEIRGCQQIVRGCDQSMNVASFALTFNSSQGGNKSRNETEEEKLVIFVYFHIALSLVLKARLDIPDPMLCCTGIA